MVIHNSIYDKKTYNFIVDFIIPQLSLLYILS